MSELEKGDSIVSARLAFEMALFNSDRVAAHRVLSNILETGGSIHNIEELIVSVLEKMGNAWESGKLALSQVYMGGRICEYLVDSLCSKKQVVRENQPKMAIAVLEDYHMLGKRMVHSQLRASGFELLDYDRVEVGGLIERIQKDRIQVLLLSTLMLPSALRIRDVKARLSALDWSVKIVVGGAPFRFDDQLWREVGADATSPTATGAIEVITKISKGAL